MEFKYDQTKLNVLCQTYGISNLFLFGSQARGDSSEDSDIDLIAKFDKPIGLIEFVKAEQELSQMFSKPVDLLTERSINPKIKESIQRDLLSLYSE